MKPGSAGFSSTLEGWPNSEDRTLALLGQLVVASVAWLERRVAVAALPHTVGLLRHLCKAVGSFQAELSAPSYNNIKFAHVSLPKRSPGRAAPALTL